MNKIIKPKYYSLSGTALGTLSCVAFALSFNGKLHAADVIASPLAKETNISSRHTGKPKSYIQYVTYDWRKGSYYTITAPPINITGNPEFIRVIPKMNLKVKVDNVPNVTFALSKNFGYLGNAQNYSIQPVKDTEAPDRNKWHVDPKHERYVFKDNTVVTGGRLKATAAGQSRTWEIGGSFTIAIAWIEN
ncbi:MAG: hypothetical protein ABI443_02305 [Chthoniobacterales bacterium]